MAAGVMPMETGMPRELRREIGTYMRMEDAPAEAGFRRGIYNRIFQKPIA